MARFLREMKEDWEKNPDSDPATPAFHGAEGEPRTAVPRPKSLAGCLKCGRDASHSTDKCSRVGTMSEEDWKTMVGDNCRKCSLHKYARGYTCTYKCAACGRPHPTNRHRAGKTARKEEKTGQAPPSKKPRVQQPTPGYSAAQQPPPPPPPIP